MQSKAKMERKRSGREASFNPGQLNALLSNASGGNGGVTSQEVRTVYTNSTDILWRKHYRNNRTRTAKYTIITFFPKSLYEQFRRVANVYFTLVAGLSLTDVSPVRPWTTFTPLGIVLGVSLVKEAVEDYKRHQADKKENGRQVQVWDKDKCGWKFIRWDQVHVGDVVKVERDHGFPADLLLLSSGTSDGVCYVETMNLDGETNLKLKKALGATNGMDVDNFNGFNSAVQCDLPNPSLYTFTGNIHLLGQVKSRRNSDPEMEQNQRKKMRSSSNYEIKTFPVSPESILLRGSSLKNTQNAYGVVVYTGHESKVMMNATEPPSKRSSLEKSIDSVILFQFTLLFFMCVSGSVLSGFWHEYYGYQHWYLALDDTPKEFTPENKIKVMGLSFITSFILYGYLIPISLYVCVEMVKIVQAMIYIRCDAKMYHAESDTAALARTSNLNEELGMIDTILTDKTGTLTCNVMEFFKCSINGKTYGTGVNEIEKANSLRKGITLNEIMAEESKRRKAEPVKGFSFYDEAISDYAWTVSPDVASIQQYLQLLAVCHTVVPEGEKENVNYQAESPDEEALVIAAKELGYKCVKRNLNSLFVEERTPDGRTIERKYEILHVLEFTSARKRQSVIYRTPEGEVILGCKGADNVIYERLAEQTGPVQQSTQAHLDAYAQAGLRTLCISYRKLSKEVYAEFHKNWTEAKTALTDRDAKVEVVNDRIERDLVLVGATAIEDRLQDSVPSCLELLANAGLRIWMLTGDKLETAVNIGYACSLLTDGMDVHTVTLNLEDHRITAQMTHEDRAEVFTSQITEQFAKIKLRVAKSLLSGLVIEGNALSYAITPENADALIDICGVCGSVICCRVSPRQKAQVTELVKLSGATTLAIGDGANDVGMIQAAHIGVGISGKEGMQAVMSSDFAIAQFKFLERLILLHGRISYKRLGRMVGYFFYKNIVLGLCLYFYNSQAFFSGQTLFDDFYLSCYNILFTSLPVLAVGIFDEDVKYETVRKYPRVYEQRALRNEYFSFFPVRTMWVLNAFYAAIVNFLFVMLCYGTDADRDDGKVSGLFSMGTCLYTTIVITVNIQIALVLDHWTVFHHFAIWGSILCWFLFLIVYGSFDPDISQNVYQLFLTIVVPTTRYWLIIVLVPTVAVLPDFFVRQIKHFQSPSDHRILQEAQCGYSVPDDMARRSHTDLRNSRLSSLTLPAQSKIKVKNLMSKRMSVDAPKSMLTTTETPNSITSSKENMIVVQNPAAASTSQNNGH